MRDHPGHLLHDGAPFEPGEFQTRLRGLRGHPLLLLHRPSELFRAAAHQGVKPQFVPDEDQKKEKPHENLGLPAGEDRPRAHVTKVRVGTHFQGLKEVADRRPRDVGAPFELPGGGERQHRDRHVPHHRLGRKTGGEQTHVRVEGGGVAAGQSGDVVRPHAVVALGDHRQVREVGQPLRADRLQKARGEHRHVDLTGQKRRDHVRVGVVPEGDRREERFGVEPSLLDFECGREPPVDGGWERRPGAKALEVGDGGGRGADRGAHAVRKARPGRAGRCARGRTFSLFARAPHDEDRPGRRFRALRERGLSCDDPLIRERLPDHGFRGEAGGREDEVGLHARDVVRGFRRAHRHGAPAVLRRHLGHRPHRRLEVHRVERIDEGVQKRHRDQRPVVLNAFGGRRRPRHGVGLRGDGDHAHGARGVHGIRRIQAGAFPVGFPQGCQERRREDRDPEELLRGRGLGPEEGGLRRAGDLRDFISGHFPGALPRHLTVVPPHAPQELHLRAGEAVEAADTSTTFRTFRTNALRSGPGVGRLRGFRGTQRRRRVRGGKRGLKKGFLLVGRHASNSTEPGFSLLTPARG